MLAQFDALLVPTTTTHYRISELQADPVRLNSNLGKYTNFVNLLDWSALAVPASLRADGLPFGITLAPSGTDVIEYTVYLPLAADNLLQGLSESITFTWTASG